MITNTSLHVRVKNETIQVQTITLNNNPSHNSACGKNIRDEQIITKAQSSETSKSYPCRKEDTRQVDDKYSS